MNPRTIHKQYEGGKFDSHRKKERDVFDLGFSKTFTIIRAIIVCLLIYYVWALNVNATRGFVAQEIKNQQDQLIMELDRLDAQIAEISSIESISSEEVLKQMEDAQELEYLVIQEGVQYVYNK